MFEHNFYNQNGQHLATCDILGAWIDLKERRLIALPEQLQALQKARKGFVESQLANADRPEAQANLGNYYSQRSDLNRAEQAYLEAIRIQAGYTPAYINLANLYSNSGRYPQAEEILKAGILRVREKATIYHALGLLCFERTGRAVAVE